jgi:hypothetical protein
MRIRQQDGDLLHPYVECQACLSVLCVCACGEGTARQRVGGGRRLLADFFVKFKILPKTSHPKQRLVRAGPSMTMTHPFSPQPPIQSPPRAWHAPPPLPTPPVCESNQELNRT